MELRHLRYFVMAAEEENISRAAHRLNVSQPAVSRQIKDLEEELGLPLFTREPNGLKLTEAGTTALSHAREILRRSTAMAQAMTAFANQSKSVSIKVGFLPTALPGFLAEAMRRMNQSHSDVCVQIFEMSPKQQEDALRKGEIDLGLIGQPSQAAKQEFHCEVIRRVEMAMVVPDNHRLAQRKTVSLDEFAEDGFLTLHGRNFPDRPKIMAELFERAGISPEIIMEASGITELLGLVGSGAGVALAPADLDQLPHSGVNFLKLKKPKRTLLFSSARRKGDDTGVIDRMVDLMKEIVAGI